VQRDEALFELGRDRRTRLLGRQESGHQGHKQRQ